MCCSSCFLWWFDNLCDSKHFFLESCSDNTRDLKTYWPSGDHNGHFQAFYRENNWQINQWRKWLIVAIIVLTWEGHGRTPAASLGSQLCGTGWLAPAPAGSSLQDVAGRWQEVVTVEADHSEARWKRRKKLSIYTLFLLCETTLDKMLCW